MGLAGINPGEMPDYIIVGLGNPGQRYEHTRHNVGFSVVDYIDSECEISRGCKRMLHSSLVDKCVLDGYVVYLIKPQTFNENAGMAVADVLNYYRLGPSSLIVIHDDLRVPFGEFKLKEGGSTLGHKGLKSIAQHIHSTDFIRFRIGVGPRPNNKSVSDYLLSKLTLEEYKVLSERFRDIYDALSDLFNYDFEYAYNGYSYFPENN